MQGGNGFSNRRYDMPRGSKSVLVTGDVVVDHHIYVGERLVPNAPEKTGTAEQITEGGAGLLFRILESIGKKRSEGDAPQNRFVVQFGFKHDVFNKLPPALNGYALWRAFPLGKDRKVWRMSQPLGYGKPSDSTIALSGYVADATENPDLLVIDDGGLGFRQNTQKEAWPNAILRKVPQRPEWIVLKMSSPVGQGDLWRHLSTHFSDRLVVVVSIEDIRREEVRVSKGISWERTALDLAEELSFNSEISSLLKCRHLVVDFGAEGALHAEIAGSRKSFHLVYDPERMEGEWSATVDGGGLGNMACLTSGIVDRLLQSHSPDPIHDGIRAGLSAMRTMHLSGHGRAGPGEPAFPFSEVAGDVLNPNFWFPAIELLNPEKSSEQERKSWTIMTAVLEGIHKNPRPLFGIGRRVAVIGPKALTQVPYARFGKLYTADRNEIESLRSIRSMIMEYKNQDKGKKPLSLAVFGPPGAGKSFGIVQIAQGILGKDVPILEFNLSQFKDPEALIGAFHQIRDRALQGTMPLVFWDEFDSGEYQWLQYLLAPMQDGKFLEGQISHPIGKSVFVFAGGTSFDMKNFGPSERDEKKWNEFKLKKGPDFISRLSGYLNVLGPNRKQTYDGKRREWVDDPDDVCYPIRRALLIRAMLGLKDNERLAIDHGILSALIEADRFKHGARSLERIVLQLKKPDVPSIRRSDLPTEEMLSMHADPADFVRIVNRDLKFKTLAEALAPFVHGFYRQLGRKDNSIRPELDRDFDLLPEDYKEDNRAAAARIPDVLDLVGLYLVPETFSKTEPRGEIAGIIEANIEMLAEAEHDDWMEHKIRNGWVYAERRDDLTKTHNCLRRYVELSETDKEKDRNSVRKYPAILKEAKYKIVSSLS
jgi:RyR domain